MSAGENVLRGGPALRLLPNYSYDGMIPIEGLKASICY
jgi:hypothetical protein